MDRNKSKNKKRARKKKKSGKNRSSLHHHHRDKSRLIPPLNRLPGGGMAHISWVDGRLAELMWACLVITVIPRDRALALFRMIATRAHDYRDLEETADWRLYHSQFPFIAEQFFYDIVQVVMTDPQGKEALRPLLLIDCLPAKEKWESMIGENPTDEDWQTLGKAVMACIDHQSQESTDVRWLSLMFKFALGRVFLPENMKEKGEQIVNYPNQGDMRSVRPSIRSMEMMDNMSSDGTPYVTDFPYQFWKECLNKTECLPVDRPRNNTISFDRENTYISIRDVQITLINSWFETLSTTGIDSRHDAAFGLCFYAIALCVELLHGSNPVGITGRLLLRSIVEARIVLRYLVVKDTQELWSRYRKFGVGQAKLASLKLDEADDRPSFISQEILDALINEDYYEEFVDIELGHWCGLDTRKMSEESGSKDDYDKYYGWTSSFAHAHWASIRDTTMMLCANPLHRLHRIPRVGHQVIESCAPDAVSTINKMVNDLQSLYPSAHASIQLIEKKSESSIVNRMRRTHKKRKRLQPRRKIHP